MKVIISSILIMFVIACDSNDTTGISISTGIAAQVKNNSSWPMTVEGVFEETNSNDAGGTDINIYGIISSSEDSYIFIQTLDSFLRSNNVADGDSIIAQIKPSSIGVKDYYDIITIAKKQP